MNEVSVGGFLEFLAENGVEFGPWALVATAVFLFFVLIYLIGKRRAAARATEPLRTRPTRSFRTAPIRQPPPPTPAPRREATTPAPAVPRSQPIAPSPPRFGRHVPEDSTLRRHFMQYLDSLLDAVAPGQPTDSVLKRHHAQWRASRFEACLLDEAAFDRLVAEFETARRTALAVAPPRTLVAETAITAVPATEATAVPPEEPLERWPEWIPSDSVLRRHYLTHLYAMLEDIHGPAPTDSVLIRHHRQLLLAEWEDCRHDPDAIASLHARHELWRSTRAQPPRVVIQSLVPETPPAAVEAPCLPTSPQPAPASHRAPSGSPTPPHIPEDSVLRRHFLGHLQQMLEVVHGPRPSDSVLRRHYEQLLESARAEALASAERLERLEREFARLT